MSRILDALGHESVVGVNLDTGNAWLGGEAAVKTAAERLRQWSAAATATASNAGS
jgi:sugar phosphate isomerase/epimerase